MYVFKLKEELLWGVGIAVAVYILGELVLFDPDAVTEWRNWAITLLAGSIRAGAGALLALIRAGRQQS